MYKQQAAGCDVTVRQVGMLGGILMKTKTIGLAALAAALISTTALAQTSPRVVSFGDSLSDNGNLFLLSGGAAPGDPLFGLYPSRRFSSGLSFAEIFAGGPMRNFPLANAGNINSGSINYAVGGSRTSGAMTPGPTTQQQIGLFLGTGGRFGAADIVTLWAGANNIFQGIPAAAATPATALATMTTVSTAAATDLGAQMNALAAAGAKTIVSINLPNFNGLPNFNFGTAAAANGLAGASSAVFNTVLSGQQAAAAAANPGANIVSVDVAGLFTAVQANPGSFGFINAAQACIRVASCATGTLAAQNTFAFWDDVHPTEAGYRLVSATVDQYVRANIYASGFSAFGEAAFEDRRGGMMRAFDRLDSLRGMKPGVNTYFVSVLGGGTNADSSARRPGYESRSYGVSFGFDRAFSNDLGMSLAGSISSGSLKSATVDTTPTNFALDAALQYSSGVYFGKVAGGFGVTNYSSTTRRTVGPLENTSSATSVNANIGAEAGLNYNIGAFSISPRARLGWVTASVDSITESGVIAPLAINSRSVSALVAGGEMRFGFDIVSDPARKIGVHALVGYERNLAYSGSTVGGRIVGNSAQPFVTSLASPKGAGLIAGGGISAKVSTNIEITGDYRAQLGHGEATRHTGQISARFAF
jgi:outer membrane lipase/esterase